MALKNIMRVDNGNVIGSVDESYAENFINNNLITSVNGTDVEFKFIYDSTQDKFGYRDASGTFVPFESGGDFSQLIYENLAAANIKSGTTISVKDPDGNVLNSATGSYTVNTFTNLKAANIKNGTTVTIKDTAGTTLKSVTGTYTGAKSWNYSCAYTTMGATVTLSFNPYFIAVGDWASFGRYFLGCYARNPDTGAAIYNITYAMDSDTNYNGSITVSGKTFKVNSYYSAWNGRSIYYWAIGY